MTFTADPIRAKSRAGSAEHSAKHDVKYHLKAGDMYLNQRGLHLQQTRLYAWCGTIEQARNMRRDYPAAAGCKAHRVLAEIVLNSMEA